VDVWGAILVLIRRFYLTVPIAALTMFGGYSYAHGVAPEYHATSSIVILGPTAGASTAKDAPPAPANPYATMSLTTLLTALQIDVTNAQSMAAITAAGGTGDFSMNVVNRSSIVLITATSENARQAVNTAGEVVNLVKADLANRQKPYTTQQQYQVTAQVIGVPALQPVDTKSRTRAEAIALGAAIVTTIILVLVIDAMLERRARQRRRRERSAPEDELETANERRSPVVRS
jgi:capsular polysaccharide biosynthesis protein